MTTTLRTKKYAICRHGISLLDRCVDCELASARDLVAQWGDEVDKARCIIAQTSNPLIAKLYEGLERLEAMNGRRK